MASSGEKSGVLGNILVIFAFVVVIAIAIWGAMTVFRLAPRIFSFITSPFGGSPTTLTIVGPSVPVVSGENMSLTWSYGKGDDSGMYSFTYSCVSDFYFEAPVAEGGVYGPITCNLPYGVPGTETGIRLTPKSRTSAEVIVPVSVSYVDSSGNRIASATSTITVTGGTQSTTPPNTSTPTTPTSPKPTKPSTPTTPADLMIRMIDSGTVDAYSGLVTVRFEVKNVGGRATGVWRFVADLPTYNGYRYSSPMQRSLNQGDGIIFTLQFDKSAGGVLSITVDPENAVSESSENNNYLSQTIGGGGYYEPYNTQYDYYPDYYMDYPTYNYGY